MTTTNPKCSAELAAKRTRILLGCYRKGDCEDPEVYVPAVASVLARYSPRVVQLVTDPADGLPSRSDWLPTVREVRAACEAEAAKQYQLEARNNPPRLPAPEKPVSPEERERAVANWERIKQEIFAKNLVGTPEVQP